MKQILLDECKRMIKPAGIALGYLLVFGIVLYLYNVPMEPVLYGFFLSVLGLLLIFGADLYGYARRYQKILAVRGNLNGRMGELPKADSGTELIYQEMLEEVYRKNQETEEKWSAGYEDLVDYYTTWAHQIKTPISAMGLLLQQEGEADKKKLSLELFKVEQYVEMALGYLRTEEMSKDLQIREYSLDEIIRQGVKKYAKMFILKKISLHYDEVGERVITDEKWLLFVLEQFLSNALKYTPGGGCISIYMEEQQEKTLVISDTGIGISPEDLPRVWERGFTGYNGRLDKKATGIGLYSAKKIADRLGHGLYLTSQVGVGTQVHLDLSRYRLDFD